MKRNRILIATIKSWNINNAFKFKNSYEEKYDIIIFSKKDELDYDKINEINPKYIFFPHWSWIIPEKVYVNFECIVFHMTDLPYGRGGSPLQNLIVNKVYNTKVSAIKVGEGLDTGKIYLKEPFYIGLGSSEEIFRQMSDIIFFKMIPYILENSPVPFEQAGEPVIFKRRTPQESNMINITHLDDIYDFIRMLDGEGYPKAFLKTGKFRIEFSEVHRKSNKLVGRFEINEE
ncbi:MAG: methionyl-tRNA formyltransferase [Candidatus Eremiobacterota bacterium]